jgi:hypothetical protein
MSIARMYHGIATELGCDPELVGVVAKELGLKKRIDVKHAVQERLSQTDATRETEVDEPGLSTESTETTETPSPSTTEPKAKKPGLTLSQRRALLRLQDAGSVTPASAFKALPYLHLVDCGYADVDADAATDGVYTLTAEGRDRAASVNPGYRVWSAGETVADDPSRPLAGTRRSGLDIDDLRHVTPVAELPVA